jgi:hypothetical protein
LALPTILGENRNNLTNAEQRRRRKAPFKTPQDPIPAGEIEKVPSI